MFQALVRRVPFRALCFIAAALYILFHDRPPRNFIPHFEEAKRISKYLQTNLTHTPWIHDIDSAPRQQPLACPACPLCPMCPNATTVTIPCPPINDIPLTLSPPARVPPSSTYLESPASTEQQIMDNMRAEGIQVIFKTGAQELTQLAINLGTTLRFFDQQDVLFFSDMHDSIGPFTVHDSLRNVDQTIRDNHADFEIYRKLKQYHMTGQNIQDLVEESSRGDGRSGWRLDKWKFLHMIEEAYKMRPNSRWYVFIETDSYVVWRNLVAYLKRFDHRKPLFMGSALGYGSIAFAHGGSGYVISNAAMNKILGPAQPEDLAARWDTRIQGVCCGDMALADALHEKGVDLTGAHPFFNGYKPTTFTYGPQQHWCQPVVTMHHVVPGDVSDIWRYERQRETIIGTSNFTLFADLYHYFVEPHIAHKRENWDNLSHGPTYTKDMLDEENEVSERKKKLDDSMRKTKERNKHVEDTKDKEQKRLKEESQKEDETKEGSKDNRDDEQTPDGTERRRPKRPLRPRPSVDEDIIDVTLDDTVENLFARKRLRRRGWEVNEKTDNKGWDINKKVEHSTDNKETDDIKEEDDTEMKNDADQNDESRKRDEAEMKDKNSTESGKKEEAERMDESDNKNDTDQQDNSSGLKDEDEEVDQSQQEAKLKKEVEERRNWEEQEFRRLAIEKEVQRQVTLATNPARELSEAEKVAHESFEDCRNVCEGNRECFQFAWWKDTCKLGLSFRLGKYQEPDRLGEGMVISGWMVQRIRDWTEANACTAPRWEWY